MPEREVVSLQQIGGPLKGERNQNQTTWITMRRRRRNLW
jgi:hypothetical protein